MVKTLFTSLTTNKEAVFDEFRERVRDRRNSDSTKVLINALLNKLNPSLKLEVKTAKLDDKGLEVLFLIQFYGIAHSYAGRYNEWRETDLENLAKELEILK